MKLLRALTVAAIAVVGTNALSFDGQNMVTERTSDGLQNVVTYDSHSLIVNGERIFVLSAEFHPFRLPVPDLWLDVFQKIKAAGFSAVSFYVHWAMLEGQPGTYIATGSLALEPFFDAAKQAGIYLIARPGPYINAEVSGGGFPGWLSRVKGQLRTRASDYLAATDNYMANVGAAIAKAQITNGGPVILVQPENEYTGSQGVVTGGFPDPTYFAYVKNQLRKAGVTVPLISNDAYWSGILAPGWSLNGSKIGDVDIYGHDSYPLGFDCSNPYTWPAGDLLTYYHYNHEQQSPSTFFSIDEFQAGAYDYWGGHGFEQCSVLLNMEFERVFYKNNYASGIALLSLYMVYGGTNWGNLGYPGGYTSYEYGAAIKEGREIVREKYSELKLQGNFLKVSPAFLTSSVSSAGAGYFVDNSQIFTTQLTNNPTNFYIVRHNDYQKTSTDTYTWTVKTSKGSFAVPQLGGKLSLNGRDSKWHVSDYDLGGINLVYSSAEIFSWKNLGSKTVLFVYSAPGEQNELAVATSSSATVLEGSGVTSKMTNGITILNWKTSTIRRVVELGSLFIYILDRNSAYNYWVADFVRDDLWGAFTANVGNTTSVIVRAGYLIRSVSLLNGSALHISGDLNATVPFSVVGAPATATDLYFNDVKLSFTTNPTTGEWSSTANYASPKISIPDFSSLNWKYLDNLPEIQSGYDDSLWTVANKKSTNNPTALKTPTSLYGADYGFNTGVLIFRGHYVSNGGEKQFFVNSQGGSGFSHSVWLNNVYLGSGPSDGSGSQSATYNLPSSASGKSNVITVVVDQMGFEENWNVGADGMKAPRGILSYSLTGRQNSDVTWKMTGNLGGEAYVDKVRGPLNEGGLYAERQGFLQPNPPSQNWAAGSPQTGISSPGIALYSASFDLNLPSNYDIPLYVNFGRPGNNNYRVQLWINGYQFGKFINNLGPQTSYPVPPGILNYNGTNWIGIELWSQQSGGSKLTSFSLQAGTPIWTGMKMPALVPMPSYTKRSGAY